MLINQNVSGGSGGGSIQLVGGVFYYNDKTYRWGVCERDDSFSADTAISLYGEGTFLKIMYAASSWWDTVAFIDGSGETISSVHFYLEPINNLINYWQDLGQMYRAFTIAASTTVSGAYDIYDAETNELICAGATRWKDQNGVYQLVFKLENIESFDINQYGSNVGM